MESVESELFKTLENLFGFQFGKGKKFQDLDTHDFLDVYKIFFRIYDSAWLLSDGKPKTTVLKQIQSFLQRMELGHLILKGEDLLDSKKNCRLLGAIVSKLESRHNGTNNIQSAVRKIRLLKPKAATGKNHLRKASSTASSVEEEPVNPELIIPHKGKELPRTPPLKQGFDTDVDRPDFLVPKLAPPITAVNLKTYTNSAKIVCTQKGFRCILPTKEIPRTPMKGVGVTTSVDGFPTGHNLTVDFSAARLTSSNTSTPYDSRNSGNQNSSSDGDATFIIPAKRRVMKNPDPELSESGDEDVFVDDEAVGDTFVKQTNLQERMKPPPEGFNNTRVLELDSPNTKNENLLPPDVLAEPQSTVDDSKKKPGKAPVNGKAKGKPSAAAAAKAKDDEVVTVKRATDTMPENAETNHVATDTLTVVAKGKKGKKVSKKEATEDNHVGEPVADAIAEIQSPAAEKELLEPAPSAEPKGKKGRGKKAVGKKEAIEINHVEDVVAANTDPPVALEVPVAETEAKKGRAKRPSKKETSQDNHAEEVLEKKAGPPTEVEAEQPVAVAEAKGKRGRGKKTLGRKEAVEDDHVDSVPASLDASPQEAEVVEEKKGRGKRPSKKETSEENTVKEIVEKEPGPESSSPVVETKEKRGRGKKAQPTSKTEANVSLAEDKPEPVLSCPGVENNDDHAVKSGPKAKLGPKSKTGSKSKVEAKAATEENDSPANPEPEIQEKKGRGKKAANQPADCTSPSTTKIDPPQVQVQAVSVVKTNDISPAPEVRRGRAKGKATSDDVNEPEHKQVASPVALESTLKEKRGRGRPAAKDGADKAAKTDEEALPNVQSEPSSAVLIDAREKRGRGRQAKTEATPVVEEMKDTAQSPEAVPAKKGRAKKAAPVAKESDETEKEVEAVADAKAKAKAKGKKAAAKKAVEEEPVVPEVPEKRTNKRGKAAVVVQEEADSSRATILKVEAAEVVEGLRKSSRRKADPVKSYDESSEKSGPISPKKRGGKRKGGPIVDEAAIAEAEEVEDQKKKAAKNRRVATPEPEPPKAVGPKRTSKRGQADETSPPTTPEQKGGSAAATTKKATHSPESPLKVVNGLEADLAASPAKRGKSSEENGAVEEPEKKRAGNRKKKEMPQPVESENESPHVGAKKGQRGGKEEAAPASAEVEKKKPASRKKLVAAQEEETDIAVPSVQSRARGKRTAALTSDSDVFVTFIAGQQSTDPSPAGPPQTKSRRLKLVEQPTAAKTAESDDEVAVAAAAAAAPATKRTYGRRNK